jgi:hypothetical protein
LAAELQQGFLGSLGWIEILIDYLLLLERFAGHVLL